MTNGNGRRNRHQTDIIADMLKTCDGGDSKTHIMYRANLSYPLLQKYLRLLLERGLMIQSDREYRVSRLGRDYLQIYEEAAEMRRVLQEKDCDLRRLTLRVNFYTTVRKVCT